MKDIIMGIVLFLLALLLIGIMVWFLTTILITALKVIIPLALIALGFYLAVKIDHFCKTKK